MLPDDRRSRISRTILIAWAIAGTLDISDAILFYWFRSSVPPQRLLQNIAAGLIGRSAFSGGVKTALLGLAIHYAIALAWTVLFVLAAQRLAWLVRHPFAAAIGYGAVVFLAMNFVVLPVFHAGVPPSHFSIALVNAVLALMLPFALPITLVTSRFTPR